MTSLLKRLRLFRRHRQSPSEQSAKEKSSGRKLFGRLRALYVSVAVIAVVIAFFWVTSARLLQEPIKLDFGPRDPVFASAFGPLVGAEFVSGNSAQILVNGDGFFPDMLRAIRGAQKSITFETYIWAPGAISEEFIAALSERARAGVKVHVLMDGMGTLKFKREDRERMQAAGIETYTYGRERWYYIKPNINHRTHRKLLVVDGKIGFTGGMCIDDRWAGNADSKKSWRETGVRVEGPVVRQMQAVFAANWLQTTSRLLIGDEYYPKIESTGSVPSQCFPSGPNEGPEAARLGYLFAIAAARESIDISHAYFIPDDLAIKTIVAAAQRGVRVRVIVPAINDSRMGRAVARSRWADLLAAGVEFYQYQPAMYHCKTMTVDGLLVTIGSANFDNRSFTINDEITLNTLDRNLAAQHLRMFEDDLKNSVRLTREEFEARPVYVKWFDSFCGLFRSQF